MEKNRGSVESINKIVKLGKKITVEEMASIAEFAEAIGGSLTAVDPEDNWCGNGRIHFPWPPKNPTKFVELIDILTRQRINFEVLINGIPVPDYLVMTISRKIGQQFNSYR